MSWMSNWRMLLPCLLLVLRWASVQAQDSECRVLASPKDGNPRNYENVDIFWR
jgi:hypothetical protein